MEQRPYKMEISRLTIDKLGVKLYDKISAAIAEIISNSYDADATEVIIEAPMGRYLAKKADGTVTSIADCEIRISDNGIGMMPSEINELYLKVGRDRRGPQGDKDESPRFKRKVMGRKGIGKLAPFGICHTIEIISAGGSSREETLPNGKQSTRKYEIAHFILNRDDMLKDVDEPYYPTLGKKNGEFKEEHGTTIILKNFNYRKVPNIEILKNQIAKRFGISSPQWKIYLIDTTQPQDNRKRIEIGGLDVEEMPNTKIRLSVPSNNYNGLVREDGKDCNVILPNKKIYKSLKAGFQYEGKFYPINGWIAYAKSPYEDENMAGVRIYCRGKIAAQTRSFNIRAGFTGEHSIRSYLIGEIYAEWLDEEEDLIHTDRRDILWSHELGESFEKWGQKIVKLIGKISRHPIQEKMWERFIHAGRLEERINRTFPGEKEQDIRDKAMRLGKMFGKAFREDEVEDEDVVNSIVDLILVIAPDIVLDEKLEDAGRSGFSIKKLSEILKTARIAELVSYGRIVQKHVKIIEQIENSLEDSPKTIEPELQKILSDAPWLINPQWTPMTANQTLNTLKREIEKRCNVTLQSTQDPNKRPDFVLQQQGGKLQLIEIKAPGHKLTNKDMANIVDYNDNIKEILEDPTNKEWLSESFKGIHITLICDNYKNLSGTSKAAFEAYKEKKLMECIGWSTFLGRAKEMYIRFLDEVNPQGGTNGNNE